MCSAPIAAGLARQGAWPALACLRMVGADPYQYLTLDAARRWAPALVNLRLGRSWQRA
jgi:hypothetical protein